MSLFKRLVDSFSEFFSSVESADSDLPLPPPSAATMDRDRRAMDGAVGGSSVVNERIVQKLKGYFELAKEEIDKAVRAEEWGLLDEAIAHYRNAQRVMLEAKSARGPSSASLSEHEKVKSYQQKISKWQGQVSERLQVLSTRTSGTPPIKATITHPLTGTVSSSISGARKAISRNPSSLKRNSSMMGKQANNNGGSKPIQEAVSSYDTKLVEMINTAIVDRSPAVKWDDVAGLEKAKQTLLEMVILPTKRRDLFTGLRKPARGLLLFGPPGNGKTMLAKAVASESEATFFNVSASSLTSKWVGEAEKLVRTLFMVAVSRQPSVIFMDEIDSIMSTRLANENDASRRLKSEFLVQFDGVASDPNDLVIVIGATNKPQELDDAVLRRLCMGATLLRVWSREDAVRLEEHEIPPTYCFADNGSIVRKDVDIDGDVSDRIEARCRSGEVKRIYIPLPDENVRRLLLKNQLRGQAFSLPGSDVERLVKETEGYSGSDLQALCEEAAMMPIRELGPHNILTIKANQVRPLRYGDFQKAMAVIRPSLQKSKWEELEQWNKEFGSN